LRIQLRTYVVMSCVSFSYSLCQPPSPTFC